MKICPTCGSEFEGSEVFCPNDGNRLDEVSETAGQLLGEVLVDAIKLERLDFADAMAERFVGRMTDSKRSVYVTVFNRAFLPSADASRLVESSRARVGSPLPESLSTLLRVELKNNPPFVVESAPRGPSIRTLLEERGRLDWKVAARIAANVARLIEWMTSHGLYHHGLHPGSIFVTDLSKGSVQLAEWYTEEAQWVENPLQALNSDPGQFVGYVAYMAPELAEDSGVADLRSSVYALGVLLYEMVIGKPPFVGPNSAEVLRRHVHEQPVRLSIARSGGEVHPDLDQLVEMMLAKNPDKRFQAPAAIVAALSNLIGESPDQVAPAVQRAARMEEDDIYQTIEMSQIDRSRVPGLPVPNTGSTPKSTMKISDGSGESTPKQTLMMGNIGKAIAEEARRMAERDSEGEEVEADEVTSTLLMGSAENLGTKAKEKPAPLDPWARDDSGIIKPKKIGKKDEEDVTVETSPEEIEKALRKSKDATPEASISVSPDLIAQAADSEVSSAKDEVETSEVDTAVDRPAVAKVEVATTPTEPVAPIADEPVEEPITRPAEGFDEGNIGFVEAESSVEVAREDWFSRSTEDAWEDTMLEEHHQRAETTNRTMVYAIMGALVLSFIGLFVYFQFVHAPEEEEKKPEVVQEVAPPVDDTAERIQQAKSDFDSALKGDRLVSPVGNSALTHLETLKRLGAESEEFIAARDGFVTAATAGARAAEAANDLLKAQTLAGYASQWAPNDADLAALAERLRAKYSGAAEAEDAGTDGPDAGAVADAGEPEVPEEPTEPEKVEPEKTKPEKVAVKKPTPKKPKTTPAVERNPREASALAKQARSAYSRGDIKHSKELYEAAMELDPSNHTIYSGLGQVYFDKASYSKAVKYQKQAVKLKPARADYRIALGQSYYRLGRYNDAIRAWEAVLDRDPNNKNARQYIQLAKNKLK